MKLRQLLTNVDYRLLSGDEELEIGGLAYDSRKVVPGSLFVCLTGAETDGHQYIEQAIANGAAAILAQRVVETPPGITVVLTDNTRRALALASCEYFSHPSRRLKVIGITGTKGKTSTSYMVRSLLEQAGHKTGLIGTIEYRIGERSIKAINTTPESYELQQLFRQMLDEGCDCVVMEVSSQGLMMDRVTGTAFDVGVFNNLSPDHIGPGEHDSMESYMESKKKLFRMCDYGLFNKDDEHAAYMMDGAACESYTFGLHSPDASFVASDIRRVSEPGWLGCRFRMRGMGIDEDITVGLPGEFSVGNALGAIAACRLAGMLPANAATALEHIQVIGRTEFVPARPHFTLLIDYAHNAISMRNLLTTLREYRPHRLICLFGGGGNRARMRRFEMSEISGELADLTILTTDNPRFEEPAAIFEDMKVGLGRTNGRYEIVEDRAEAIRHLIDIAEEGDIAVLIGKGHERYQDIKGVKHYFNEREVVEQHVGS